MVGWLRIMMSTSAPDSLKWLAGETVIVERAHEASEEHTIIRVAPRMAEMEVASLTMRVNILL